MMKYQDNCVDCPAGIPCLGDSCPLRGYVEVCDECEEANALYTLEGEHLCGECLENRLNEYFTDLSLEDRASLFDLYCHTI